MARKRRELPVNKKVPALPTAEQAFRSKMLEPVLVEMTREGERGDLKLKLCFGAIRLLCTGIHCATRWIPGRQAAARMPRAAICVATCAANRPRATLNSLEKRTGFRFCRLATNVSPLVQPLAQAVAKAMEPVLDEQLGTQLMTLVGAFPNAGKADLKIFGAALAMEVSDPKPSGIALARACRHSPAHLEMGTDYR